MPPRHNYWTIIFGNQATSFRAATQEELLPTLKQLQAKHPDAVMMWFASGRLWKSEDEARQAREARWAKDRPRDPRGPKPAWRDRPQGDRPRGPKPEWRDRPPAYARKPSKPRSGDGGKPAWRDQRPKPDWKERAPKPQWRDRSQGDRPTGTKPAWRDRPQGDRPAGGKAPWKDRPPAYARKPFKPGYGEASPKSRSGEGGQRDRPPSDRPAWQNRGPKPPWKDRPKTDRPWQNRGPKPAWRDRPEGDRPRGPKPEWRERPPAPPASPKSRSDEGGKPRTGEGGPAQDPNKRGRDWRPGGQHKDPRDRFKVPRDVKRARFKDKLRRDRANPKKKKDEE